MIVSQAVLDELKQIGLNLYERKLWVALLSRGTSTAGELSSLAKVPHSRTYDVLESLTEKGFVMTQSSKPLKYVAVPPNEALERSKKKITEEADITINRITKLQSSAALKQLENLHKKGFKLVEPGEMTSSLKGSNALHQQLETVFKGAKKDISVLTTEKGLQDLEKKHYNLLKKASKRGVNVRIAAPFGKETMKAVERLKDVADIRGVAKEDAIGSRFAIIDGSHVVMSLTDEKVHPTQDMSLWSQSDHVADNLLKPMFEMVWKKSKN
ncbi:MAG: TrmB family transcriptional regulator [Candidatus Aenigmarchaeota archaeon]|nr:TrmB family transcriptional regulator [Candidatus Aenigmarchaeota archaeon]